VIAGRSGLRIVERVIVRGEVRPPAIEAGEIIAADRDAPAHGGFVTAINDKVNSIGGPDERQTSGKNCQTFAGCFVHSS